jgi:hypothetical protein
MAFMTNKELIKPIIGILNQLNSEYVLNDKFNKSEISASDYCGLSHTLLKNRIYNIGLFMTIGVACATKYYVPDGVLGNAVTALTTGTIATAIAFNFAFKNIKDIYFETATNKQYFKKTIIRDAISKINKADMKLMGNSLSSDELSQALLWGNELNNTKTGFIVEKVNSILKYIQKDWTPSNLLFWKKNKDEFVQEFGKDLMMNTKSIQRILIKLNNIDNPLNKKIINIESQRDRDNINNDSYMKAEIKKINRIAIKNANILYNNQAIEIIFLKVASDYSKGIVHEDLINMLIDMPKYLRMNNKNIERNDIQGNFEKIASLSNKMKNGLNIFEFTSISNNIDSVSLSLSDIAKKINTNLISKNGKLQFIAFEDFLMTEKENAINAYVKNKIKNPKINEININQIDIDEIIRIKDHSEKSKDERKKETKLDKAMKVGEIDAKINKRENIFSTRKRI